MRYANGVSILCAQFDTTVNFGYGAVTAPTSVEVAILPFPTSLQGLGLILTGGPSVLLVQPAFWVLGQTSGRLLWDMPAL